MRRHVSSDDDDDNDDEVMTESNATVKAPPLLCVNKNARRFLGEVSDLVGGAEGHT